MNRPEQMSQFMRKHRLLLNTVKPIHGITQHQITGKDLGLPKRIGISNGGQRPPLDTGQADHNVCVLERVPGLKIFQKVTRRIILGLNRPLPPLDRDQKDLELTFEYSGSIRKTLFEFGTPVGLRLESRRNRDLYPNLAKSCRQMAGPSNNLRKGKRDSNRSLQRY